MGPAWPLHSRPKPNQRESIMTDNTRSMTDYDIDTLKLTRIARVGQ
jgi:hypothetical protein